MKKKLSIILLLLVSFIATNVHAETTWPKKISSGDYSFLVEGFSLDIYELNDDAEQIPQGTETEYGTIRRRTTQEDIDYLIGKPKKRINLSAEDFTISPTAIKGKISEDGVIADDGIIAIKMNLSITKNDLENILADTIAAVNPTNYFIVELSMHYRLLSYPTKFHHIYNYNQFKFDISIMSFGDNQLKRFEINPSKDNIFVMQRIDIYQDDTTSSVKMVYETELPAPGIVYEFTFLDFAENEYITFADNERTINQSHHNGEVVGIVFHNLDNMEIAYDSNSYEEVPLRIENINDSPITSSNVEETVKIPNTAKSVSKIIFGISILLILVGSIIIYQIVKPKKEA